MYVYQGCHRVMLHVCSLNSSTTREGKQTLMLKHEPARKTKQHNKNTEQHGNDYNLHNTEWRTILAQHENKARHVKQLEHKNKTRHYTEMTPRPQQTIHGTTQNKQSKFNKNTA